MLPLNNVFLSIFFKHESQLQACRSCCETDELLKFEHEFIKCATTINPNQAGTAMCIGKRIIVDGSNVCFLRRVEHGVLSGLGEKLASTISKCAVVLDAILTPSDIERMTSHRDKTKQRHKLRSCTSQFEEFASKLDPANFISLLCVVNKNNSTAISAIGFDNFDVDLELLANNLIRLPSPVKHITLLWCYRIWTQRCI